MAVAFELTPLGTAGTHTGPGRPCSGYLLTHDGTRVLVDAGNGSTMNLPRYCAAPDLDAIVITHRHIDHCIDLIGMFYDLRFGAPEARQVDLYAAPEVLGKLTQVLSEDSSMGFQDVFRHVEIDGGDRFAVGGMDFTCHTSIHPVPTVSLRVVADGRTLTYSSDSAGGESLLRAAKASDVLLCEATWQGDPEHYPPGIHLTARQAAAVAEEAEVDRLVLTHILGSLDRARSVEQASELRPAVTAAIENETVTI